MRRATQLENPSAGEVAGWLVNEEELKRNRIISRVLQYTPAMIGAMSVQ
jgi:hypothetical protein